MPLRFNPTTGELENVEQGPVGDQGPEGPTGPVGPEGPEGPQGPAGSVTRFEQSFSSTTQVVVNHNLGLAPVEAVIQETLVADTTTGLVNTLLANAFSPGAGFTPGTIETLNRDDYTATHDSAFNTLTIDFSASKSGRVVVLA